jgi:hypothetical protein
MLNEMSYFHLRTANHDPKRKVDFQRNDHHRASYFAYFYQALWKA